MKQKFSNSTELHEFFLSELQKIVGVGGDVVTEENILHYRIIPNNVEHCIWASALKALFEFCTKYELDYYLDFEFGYLRVYTDERLQITLGRL